jgi:hypothetical protein
MKTKDWILMWSWVLFIVLAGPFLFSARDTILVAGGFLILAALVYFTQRRVVPIIKEKIT